MSTYHCPYAERIRGCIANNKGHLMDEVVAQDPEIERLWAMAHSEAIAIPDWDKVCKWANDELIPF